MLYHFLFPLADEYIIFNLFKYLTFRTGGAILTALIISFIIGPSMIQWLRGQQANGQPIRDDGPETHLAKRGTPTMGGLMILVALMVSTLLWADILNPYVWLVLGVTGSFGCIGFFDDFIKLRTRSSNGMSSKLKLSLQILVGTLIAFLISSFGAPEVKEGLSIPFFKDVFIQLGWFFVPFSVLVIVGASNAVNLTDGLDGLAIVPVMIAAACFALIAYLVGNAVFSGYLQIYHVIGTGELSVLCG